MIARKKWLIGSLIAAFFVVFFWFCIRVSVLEPYKVPSSTMENTILIGDHILVNKLAYGLINPFTGNRSKFNPPSRGDVIVFKYPKDPSRKFVKRVIALPGEEIEIRKKQVYINSKPIHEPYKIHLSEDDPAYLGLVAEDFQVVMVPPRCYFVLGDNRDNSRDSRAWGFVLENYILAKVVCIYWSFDPAGNKLRWDRIGKKIQ